MIIRIASSTRQGQTFFLVEFWEMLDWMQYFLLFFDPLSTQLDLLFIPICNSLDSSVAFSPLSLSNEKKKYLERHYIFTFDLKQLGNPAMEPKGNIPSLVTPARIEDRATNALSSGENTSRCSHFSVAKVEDGNRTRHHHLFSVNCFAENAPTGKVWKQKQQKIGDIRGGIAIFPCN